jgi:hypothetical protein
MNWKTMNKPDKDYFEYLNDLEKIMGICISKNETPNLKKVDKVSDMSKTLSTAVKLPLK